MPRFLATTCAVATALLGTVMLVGPAHAEDPEEEASGNPICVWATTEGPFIGTHNSGQPCFWGYPYPVACDHTWIYPIPEEPDRVDVWSCTPAP